MLSKTGDIKGCDFLWVVSKSILLFCKVYKEQVMFAIFDKIKAHLTKNESHLKAISMENGDSPKYELKNFFARWIT